VRSVSIREIRKNGKEIKHYRQRRGKNMRKDELSL
jgi:hypothetical protein